MTNTARLHFSRRHFLGLTLGATFWQGAHVVAQDARSYTFLVLGLDAWDATTGQRSDIMMVSRVDLDDFMVRTLSIPRDLYVEIPGYGYAKINDAYRHGLASSPSLDWEAAANLAAETIAHNFGVQIDGTALTDFSGFPAVIDAVGGVDVDNPYAVDDPTWGEATFPAGAIHLDGAQALVFTRTRKMDGDGGRVMRQHLVLAALLEKLQQPEMVRRLPDLIEALNGAVKTDIPLEIQAQLVAALPKISREDLLFTNIEGMLWADYAPNGAWIYQGDWSTLPGYVQAWLDGSVD